MKFYLFFCIIGLSLITKAQDGCNNPLGVSTRKTILLMFPFPIVHFDRGVKDVMVEQVKAAKNLLLVKAANRYLLNTNLTVVTEDGGVYAFDVFYDSMPLITTHTMFTRLPHQLFNGAATTMNIQELQFYSKLILNKRSMMNGMGDAKWDMAGKVKAIFVKDDALFFQISMRNFSNINYSADMIRFYIRDKKKSKRTASQEIEVKPIHVLSNLNEVAGHSESNGVYVFNKFTIPEAKYLVVEIMEKNGGRSLKLKVRNKKLIKALYLPNI